MTERPMAIPTVQVDDETVRVTQWRFPPGAETGWHVHEMDYVVVPMTSGQLTIDQPDGTAVIADLTAGGSYSRKAGVDHNVVNANGFEFVFVEIEIKPRAAG